MMDQWDPMKDAFDNKDFNCYNEGVGRDLSGSHQRNKGVRLFVQNIPMSLGKNGLYNLFAEYGKVLHHDLKNREDSEIRGGYGFITMENLVDAETAIRKIHKKRLGQLILKVTPALSDEERNKRRQLKQQNEEMFQSYKLQDTNGKPNLQDREQLHMTQSAGFAQNTNGLEMNRGDWQPQLYGIGRGRSHQMTAKGDANYPPHGGLSHKMGMGNQAHIENASSLSSAMNQKHFTDDLINNHNYQGAGHGFFYQKAIIHPPKSSISSRVKQCAFCYKNECVHLCSRCKMYYCSNECQMKDWPRHKDICITIGREMQQCNNETYGHNGEAILPAGATNSDLKFNKFQNSRNEFEESNAFSNKTISQKSPQEKSVVLMSTKQGHFKNKNDITKPEDCQRNIGKRYQDNNSIETMRSPNYQNKIQESDRSPSQLHTEIKTENVYRAKPVPVEAKSAPPSVLELSLAITTSGLCYLTYYESPYKFWISLQQFLEAFAENTLLMEREVSKMPIGSPIDCQVGGTYGVMYMGEWSRVKVMSIRGRDITVFYLDYGNQATVKHEDLRPLTREMLELPAQAICCSVSKITPRGSESWNTAACTAVKEWLGEPMTTFLEYEIVAKKGSTHLVNISQQNTSMRELLLLGGFAEEQGPHALSNMSSNVDPPRYMAHGAEKLENLSGKLVNVVVSFIKSPAEFYIQLNNKHDLFITMMNELKRAAILSPILSAPFIGSLTAIQFSEDLSWCRGKIENIENNKCMVYFIDYGNTEEALLSNLKVLPPSVCSLPAQAIRCHLEGNTENLSRISSAEFKQQLENRSADVRVYGSNAESYSVQVLLNGKDILPTSQEMHHVSPTMPTAIQHPASDLSISMEILPGTKELIPATVTHIDSGSRLFITRIDKSLQSELRQVMLKLNKPTTPLPRLNNIIIGSVCAAQYSQDGLFYRARIVEVCNQTTCIVQFVDYGNSEKTEILKLSKLEPVLTKLPGQAICCCLSGYESGLGKTLPETSPSCTADVVQRLQTELMEKIIYVKVMNRKLDSWIIEVENGSGESISRILLPPAPQIALTPMLSDLIIESPSEKEFDAVFSYIENLSEFYCQRYSREELEELQSLTYKLRDDASKFDGDFHIDPKVNGIYASMFMENWYRCVVEEVKMSNVVIRYIDYGNTKEIPANQLRPLNPESMLVPVRLLKCKLYGVTPMEKDWSSPEMGEYLEMLQQGKVHLVIETKEKNTFLVSLFVVNGSVKVNVAEDLVDMGIAKFVKVLSPQKEERRPNRPYPLTERHQKHGVENESQDVDEYELEIQRKIQELQMELQISKQNKQKH